MVRQIKIASLLEPFHRHLNDQLFLGSRARLAMNVNRHKNL